MSNTPRSAARLTQAAGMSLTLVMLVMLILSILAAAIVFTARSETFASYSYKLDTEADYIAKAGIQEALNWLRSNQYRAVSNSQATTYYNVTSDGSPFQLYTSNSSPVNCINAASSKCPSQGSPVKLTTYGGGSSNYPADILNGLGNPAATDFASSLKNVSITDSSGNTGSFCVNAYLLSYQTVNCKTCAVNPAPMETWLITSQGSWGSSSCTGGVATAEEQAVIQPVYSSNWGNAAYGYCGVTMSGSAGTCTDAFNSALGPYGGGNPTFASGACNSASATNVIGAGAGVGANGYVSISSNPTVAGNVTIGNVGSPPPATCCTSTSAPPCGYNGATTSVKGAVLNAPPVNPPPVPSFPPGMPGNGAPSYISAGPVYLPQTSSVGLYTSPAVPPGSTISPGPGNTFLWPCNSPAAPCNGSSANPYIIDNVSQTGGTLTLVGGPDMAHPAYYDVDQFIVSGPGQVSVVGFMVLNVRTTLTLTGQGILNPLTTLPEALQINYAGTNPVSISGNGATSAIITAPNASVTLGGGGSTGYLVGAVRAQSLTVQGGYPLHYDIQLNRLEGTMGQMVVSSYSRIKH